MKSQKVLSLDVEIIKELKKLPNSSGLINEMLKDYFNQHGALKKQELLNKLGLVELDIKKKTEEMKLIRERIKEIEITESRIKSIFKNIPKEVLDDFRAFPNMTEQILCTRFKEIYSKRYNITFKEIEKAYNQYFNEGEVEDVKDPKE